MRPDGGTQHSRWAAVGPAPGVTAPHVSHVAAGELHPTGVRGDDEPPVPVDRLGEALDDRAVRQRHRHCVPIVADHVT